MQHPNPAILKFFSQLASSKKTRKQHSMTPFWTLTPEQFIRARNQLSSEFKKLAGAPALGTHRLEQEIALSQDYTVKVTCLTPENLPPFAPTLIYFPGVGFTLNLNMHDIPCSHLAHSSRSKVIIVEGPLAPEHPFPHGPNAAYLAACYFYDHAHDWGIDSTAFALGGDSSGGNFAALTAIRLRDERPDIKLSYQLLISPNTDETLDTYRTTPYKPQQDQDKMISPEVVTYFRDLYLPKGVDPKSPRVSPLFARLDGLPPTLLTCGEFDGVRGDTEAYETALKNAGNKVTKILWSGQVHNSMLCRGALNDDHNPALTLGKAIQAHRAHRLDRDLE